MDDTSPPGWAGLDLNAMWVLAATMMAFAVPMLVFFPPVPAQKRDALALTHTRAGLARAESVLAAQFAPEHAARPGARPSVRGLYVYPIKSCKGIELARSRVVPAGLEFDRLFTFAQLKSVPPPSPAAAAAAAAAAGRPNKGARRWDFATGRQYPRMTMLDVELWLPDIEKTRGTDLGIKEAFIIIRFPWRDRGFWGAMQWLGAKLARGPKGVPEKEVLLPVDFPSREEIEQKGYAFEQVRIWNETVTALNMEKELPEELKVYLGVKHPLALFRINPEALREVFRTAPTKEEAGYQPVTGFQDAFPIHLMNLTSMHDLDAKLKKDENLKQLDVRRFRSNVIISGAEPYDEETWKSIRFHPAGSSSLKESSSFHVSCRCVRCKLPNVDPDTGIPHKVEPDKSLRTHRAVDEGAPRNGCLGMNLCPLFDNMDRPENLELFIENGMTVEVLQRGEHVYIPQ